MLQTLQGQTKTLEIKLSKHLLAYWFRAVAYCAKLRCLSPIVFPEKTKNHT